MKLIEVNRLSKKIRGKEILKDISFTINEGECVALIGPNGAGKTTLMDCLLGDKFLTSGQASVRLNFFQSIYPRSLTNQEVDALLTFTDKQKDQLASKLSGGQKRLFSFILALIGRPKILFLDEPTSAMDTSTRQHFWEIVDELKKKGVTIIYSSHYIEEVEHTADRILVLHN